jgi:hypothetical protein
LQKKRQLLFLKTENSRLKTVYAYLARLRQALDAQARLFTFEDYPAMLAMRVDFHVAYQTLCGRKAHARNRIRLASMQPLDICHEFRFEIIVNFKIVDYHRLRHERHLSICIDSPDKSYVEQHVRGIVYDEIAERGCAHYVRNDVILIAAGGKRRPLVHHQELQ